MQGALLFPQTEDRTQPVDKKLLMIRLELVPWLETTTAVGMGQPFAVRPSHSHGEVQTRSGQFSRRACLARHALALLPRPDGSQTAPLVWLHKGCTNDSGNITPKLIF